MDARSWATVFQRIPPEKEDLLVVVTSTGVEIVIQKIVRVEAEFVVIKGRISGATEAARAVLMPYSQINNLAVNRQMLEPDILTVFGLESSTSQRRSPSVEPKRPETPAEAIESPDPAPAPPVVAVPATVPPRAQPSKSVFLQRLRERLSGDPAKIDSV